jgi:pyruvate,water dikinase
MVYAVGGTKATKNLDTPKQERSAFVLNDEEILQLARWTCAIEDHYGRPMDIEWAKDGDTGELFIVQARPETVQSRKEASVMKSYRLQDKGKRLLTGLSIGDAIAAGEVCLIRSGSDISQFRDNAILVTEMTDPD